MKTQTIGMVALAVGMTFSLSAALPPDGFTVDGKAVATDWAKLDKHAETVPGNPDAARLAERTESVWTVGVPEKITDKVTLVRKMTDRGAYRRWVYTLTSTEPVRIDRLGFFAGVEGAEVSGNTDGSVMLLGGRYYGIEHPMAKAVRRPLAETQWTEADYRNLSQTIPLKELTPGTTLTVIFAYGSGSRRLDIASVTLMQDGKTAAEDVHAGFTGLA